jgi:hypothetical protein
MRRRGFLLPSRVLGLASLIAAAGAAVSSGTIYAANPAPAPPVSAISEYVEMVPTSGGDVPTGAKGSRVLPKAVTKRIDELAGSAATPLKKIASSSSFGAPTQKLRRTPPPPTTASRQSRISTAITSASLSGAASTIVTGGSNIASLLLGAMAATALAGVWVALRRRRPLRSQAVAPNDPQKGRWRGER